jgi:thiol-disulfide isomerase/thioredoxin
MALNTKTKIYIVIAAAVLVAIAILYNYYGGTANQNFAAMDNQPVNISTYLSMKDIATNNTLAQDVGQGAIADLPTKILGPNLSIGGKPVVIFVSADYCPFCAAGRWGLIMALMRFGDFSSLHYMTSSSSDVFPITPTFTFYNSTYSSDYIIFLSTETTTNVGQPLQALTGVSNVTFTTYDTSGIPFTDFGNRSIQGGSDFSPGLINKLSWTQIIAQLSNPNSTITQAVIGNADVDTAQICSIDNFTPPNVCSVPYIKAILQHE